jgi:hypothetical protein
MASHGMLSLYGIASTSTTHPCFLVDRIMYTITTTFMTLTPAVSLYYGFIGGTMTSGISCIALMIAWNSRYVTPESAFHKVFGNISKNPQIKRMFGSSFTAGDLRTYRSTAGAIAVRNGYPVLLGPKLEMVFNVHGKDADGIVAAIVSKNGYFTKIDYLSIYLPKKGNTVIIGNENAWTMKKSLEDYVSYQHKITSN